MGSRTKVRLIIVTGTAFHHSGISAGTKESKRNDKYYNSTECYDLRIGYARSYSALATLPGANSVSRARNLMPKSHNTDPTTINIVVNTNPTSSPCAGLAGSLNLSANTPINGGEIASPSVWMIKIFSANAVARTDGCV